MKRLLYHLNKGKIYLIPSFIGNEELNNIPYMIIDHIKKINIFIVESERTCRRYIKKIYPEKNIDNTILYSMGKHDSLDIKDVIIKHTLKGENIGVISEAGTPCIADPGSNIVKHAHEFEIDVVPLIGPSSIILALMGSGMNGQNFCFKGYLPVNKQERKRILHEIERTATRTGQTQIFMETPYRNNQLFQCIIKNCRNKTKLCIASNITLPSQKIKTKTIIEWKNTNIDLHKKPTIFLIS